MIYKEKDYEFYAKNYDYNFIFAKTCYNLLLNKSSYEEISTDKLKECFMQTILKVYFFLNKISFFNISSFFSQSK
jgi:hypothetical protein